MGRKTARTPLSMAAAPGPAAAAVSSRVEYRRKPVVVQRQARFAESAGEAAAECTAICCCCPCGLANLLVVVAVKLPAGLVKGVLRRRRKKAGALWVRGRSFDEDDLGICRGALLATDGGLEEMCPARSPSTEVMEVEKIMWANFYGAGFWRSPSQREKLMSSVSISTPKED